MVVATAVGTAVWAVVRYGLDTANSLAGVFGGIIAVISGPGTVYALRTLRDSAGSASGAGGTTGLTAGLGTENPSLRVPARQTPVRGREQELAELHKLLGRRGEGGMAVVCGGGGFGKTALAAETARRAAESKKEVFWIEWRDDPTRLANDFVVAARALGLPDSALHAAQAGEAVLVDVVWDHLASTNGWLIVIDNADAPEQVGPAHESVASYRGWLRPDGPGLLLITSRDTSPVTWGNQAHLVPLESLTSSAGAEALRDVSPNAGGVEAAQALSSRLGGLPLALNAAASFLAQPTSRYHSFTEYREALDREFGDLIGAPNVRANDPDVARRIVRYTWDLSLNQLHSDGVVLARPILRLLSLLAPAPIARSLLTPELLSQASRQPATTHGLDAGLAGLHRYGLLTASASHTLLAHGTTEPEDMDGIAGVALHRLVREVVAHTLREEEADTGLSYWYRALDERLTQSAAEVAAAGQAGWPTARLLAAHLLPYLDRANQSGFRGRREAVRRLADALRDAGAGLEQHLLREHLHQSEMRQLGRNHPDTLSSRNDLALSLRNLGRVQEAVELQRDALAASERVLGADHPGTLTARNNLALALRDLGRHQEAAELHRRELAASERALGPDHPGTLTARNNLALALHVLGRHQEAAELHRDALANCERVLGPTDPRTLTSRNNLASVLADLGHHQEAVELLQQNLTERESILGVNHPDNIVGRTNLATVLSDLGRHQEAFDQHQVALIASEHSLGSDHPHTLTIRNNLANTLFHLGRYQESASLHRLVWADRRRLLGPRHPDTRETVRNLTAAIAGARWQARQSRRRRS
ncbi:tetratricopeptide repeat protein [Streptomyces sp. SAS_260]|uniref:tetratricopeptide repeat protein n=1 Tax=Streptomyces sp. SAS_260 TaxID=3412751 RepID=UPI00403C8F7D